MSKSTPKRSVRRMKRWILILAVLSVLCVAAAAWILSGNGPFAGTFESTGYVMGSYMQQTVYGRNGEAAAADALTRAADTFAEQGSFLRQEARAYNQKAEKAEKLYEKLPTRFLLSQPDMYEGI